MNTLSGSLQQLPAVSPAEWDRSLDLGMKGLGRGGGAAAAEGDGGAAAAAAAPPGSNTGGKLTAEPSDPICRAVQAAYDYYPMDRARRIISCKVEGLEKRIDWLNWTFPAGLRDVVAGLVCACVGGEFVPRDRGVNTYHYSSQHECGGLLGWSSDRPEAWLSLSASLLACVLPADLPELVRLLVELGAKCTRIDGAIDIPQEWVPMEAVHAAARAAQVIGFKRYDPRRPISDMGSGLVEGDTAYFGRRGRDGSGRFVRFYDKALESNNQLRATRFEVECSGDVAGEWVKLLAAAPTADEFWRILGRLTVGSIDFADRTGAHLHRDRYKRLPWWDRIVQLADRAAVSIRRAKPPLQRSAEWAYDTLAGLFARIGLTVERHEGLEAEQAIRDFAGRMFHRGRRTRDPSPSSQPLDLARLLGFGPPEREFSS